MHRVAAFSLVEVMCAIAILAVGLVGLTTGISTAVRSTKDSEIQTRAALFAAGQIETLRAEGYYTDGTTEGECGEAVPSCQWRQTLSAAGLEGLHEVVVAIEHTRSGKVLYELRTFLFEAPLTSSSTDTQRRGSDRREADRRRQRP